MGLGMARMVSEEVSNWKQQKKAVKRVLMTEFILVLLDSPSVGLTQIHISEILNIITKLKIKVRIYIILVEKNNKLPLNVAPFFIRIIHDDESGFHYICVGATFRGSLTPVYKNLNRF